MNRKHPIWLGASLLVVLLSACSTSLQPKRQWDAAMRSEPLRDVQIEAEGGNFRGRGSGIILHSSEEHGTFILTCGHVASLSDDIRQKASLGDFADDVGKVTESSGSTVAVRVHESSANGRATWKEWMGYQGDVVFSKHVIERWPFSNRKEELSFEMEALPDISIIDVAVIHLRTGAEPLSSVQVAPEGMSIEDGWSNIRGISYFENRPYQEDVVLLNDRLFGVDGNYCSGSGLYDSKDRLIGIYTFRSGLTSGELAIDGQRQPISAFYYYVPMETVRAELRAKGLGFLVE